MRGNQILDLLRTLVENPYVKEYTDPQRIMIKIRTDNGPQFIARKLAETLKSINVKHVFIQPGTPQQNGHVESFHGTVTRLACNRHIFDDIDDAREVFEDFFQAYNHTRAMAALLYHPPVTFLKMWKSGGVGIKRDKKTGKNFSSERSKPLKKDLAHPLKLCWAMTNLIHLQIEY